MRGSSAPFTRQLRPRPGRPQVVELHTALEPTHRTRTRATSNIVEYARDIPLPSSPTSTSSSPVHLALTPHSSDQSSSEPSREELPDITEQPLFIHLPGFFPPTPVRVISTPTPIILRSIKTVRVPALIPPVVPQMASHTFQMPLRGTPATPKFDGNPRELIRLLQRCRTAR
jgi:hypothetical protein